MVHKAIPFLVGGMLFLTAVVTWASTTGVGAPKPEKQPVSIREGSVRHTTGTRRHRRRTHYFVGGGHRYGK